jgi:outer membrane protein assembly factor BamA
LIKATDSFFTPPAGSTDKYAIFATPAYVNVNGQNLKLVNYTENVATSITVAGGTYQTTCAAGYSTKLGAVTAADGCSGTGSSAIATRTVAPFNEYFFANTPRPRLSIGFGVNWNSPFGPFRIDVAKALLKTEGDQTKLFTFNVGTQF